MSLDFLTINFEISKKTCSVYPDFIVGEHSDLMIKGGDFYAIYVEETGFWSTKESTVIKMIDKELDRYVEQDPNGYIAKYSLDKNVRIMYMSKSSTGSIDRWHKYVQRQCRDNWVPLDEKFIFADQKPTKKDYATHKLEYSIQPGDMPAYERLRDTLYSEKEAHKLEWITGCILSLKGKETQKFGVLYGSGGTGKGTFINEIWIPLFKGYYCIVNTRAMGSANNQFALEPFKNNPLVAIDPEGDLSRVEDNTMINSVVAHDEITVNAKFERMYSQKFNCFLLVATNKPVRITDAKSGLIRRLIDIHPTGNKIPYRDYKTLIKQVKFELGAIASHCIDVYNEDPDYYEEYVPTEMIASSNNFYNFVMDKYDILSAGEGVQLKQVWALYKEYAEEAQLNYKVPMYILREELKNYYSEYIERGVDEKGTPVRSFYKGFKLLGSSTPVNASVAKTAVSTPLVLDKTVSLFDKIFANQPAQYAKDDGTPRTAWHYVNSKLSDINTYAEHYVKVPSNLIVIDFDLKDKNGKKDIERNLLEAAKWPATYAELSRSGSAVHLHYYYSGDPTKLEPLYDKDIEIKVYTGNLALRRRLTKCNDIPIATLNSGLPLKKEEVMNDGETFVNSNGLKKSIVKALRKEIPNYPNSTINNINFIKDILDKAYASGKPYDVSEFYEAVLEFAKQSSHHGARGDGDAIRKVNDIHFKSDEKYDRPNINPPASHTKPFVMADAELFPSSKAAGEEGDNPGLFLLCYSEKDKECKDLINPTANQMIDWVNSYEFGGFNNKDYDNMLIWLRMQGYDNDVLYDWSNRHINAPKDQKPPVKWAAKSLSKLDVYDMMSGPHRQVGGLKKWEYKLKLFHLENSYPWNKPLPIDKWPEIIEYCHNDVRATWAVFEYCQGDYKAREMLALLSGMTVNDSTNNIAYRIVGGPEMKIGLVYTNLATGEQFGPGEREYTIDGSGRIFNV